MNACAMHVRTLAMHVRDFIRPWHVPVTTAPAIDTAIYIYGCACHLRVYSWA